MRGRRQEQIPYGDDRKKSNGKGKGNCNNNDEIRGSFGCAARVASRFAQDDNRLTFAQDDSLLREWNGSGSARVVEDSRVLTRDGPP